MGSPSGSAPGTFKYEVEFVSDDEDDARDDDVVRAEIHFHDVLTEEYASYGVKLPVPWLRGPRRPSRARSRSGGRRRRATTTRTATAR